MRYAEYAPPDALSTVLHCLWTFEDDAGGGEPQRIVPDGRCELLVHFGEPYREAGSAAPQPRVVFAGQLTQPPCVEATGRAGVVGARFRTEAARSFLGLPMDAATDRRLDLAELWPDEANALVREVLAEQAAEARVARVARFVARRVRDGRPGEALARCLASLREDPAVPVEELARAAGLSRRQLERRFLDVVGVSPALLADIFRFRRVFDAIERDSSRPWTDAAAAAGYCDQSHLIRDFRRFVGCTPTEFAASRPGLATALVR